MRARREERTLRFLRNSRFGSRRGALHLPDGNGGKRGRGGDKESVRGVFGREFSRGGDENKRGGHDDLRVFDFADFERFTVAAAKTLKGDELVETLYAYDAPFQDEELLSLTRATIEEKSPELTRLGYYPLLTGRTAMTTFVCGADGDCSPVAELIYTILTEEQL